MADNDQGGVPPSITLAFMVAQEVKTERWFYVIPLLGERREGFRTAELAESAARAHIDRATEILHWLWDDVRRNRRPAWFTCYATTAVMFGAAVGAVTIAGFHGPPAFVLATEAILFGLQCFLAAYLYREYKAAQRRIMKEWESGQRRG